MLTVSLEVWAAALHGKPTSGKKLIAIKTYVVTIARVVL